MSRKLDNIDFRISLNRRGMKNSRVQVDSNGAEIVLRWKSTNVFVWKKRISGETIEIIVTATIEVVRMTNVVCFYVATALTVRVSIFHIENQYKIFKTHAAKYNIYEVTQETLR